jgi:hypothetical protein
MLNSCNQKLTACGLYLETYSLIRKAGHQDIFDNTWKIPSKPSSLHQHEHNNRHRHSKHMQEHCSELLRPAIGVTLTRFNELAI